MQNSVAFQVQTRFSDFDMLGHLNNAAYATYIELARVHFYCEVLGVDISKTTGVVAEFSIAYKKPIRFGTPIAILTRAETECGQQIAMSFDFVDARDHSKIFAQATQRKVILDVATGKKTFLPEAILARMKDLMGSAGSGELAAA